MLPQQADLKAQMEQKQLMEIQVAMEAENNRCNFARQYVFSKVVDTSHQRATEYTTDDLADFFDVGYGIANTVDAIVSHKLKAVADRLNPHVKLQSV